MAFVPRATQSRRPDPYSTWYKHGANYNPCIEVSHGTVLPNCVGYAYGRFSEIIGQFDRRIPTCNAGLWLETVRAARTFDTGKEPRLGAVLVLKKPGAAGHVAIVEQINSDGSIITSGSGYSLSWDNFWMLENWPAKTYQKGSYIFQGFIYNPAVSETQSGLLALDDANHPAQKFVNEALSHVGASGHAWVQSVTSIGSQAWCAATVCAVAITCGFAGKIMPKAQYSAHLLGQQIVEDYNGIYMDGAKRGGNPQVQIGDLFFNVQKDTTKWKADHVGIVRGVSGDTLLTVEGNHSNSYATVSRRLSDISWFVRPDWTKVGGSIDSDPSASLMTNSYSAENGVIVYTSPYTSKSTKADATIREVGCLTKECEPSIQSQNKATDVRLSILNYTSAIWDMIENLGVVGFSSVDTSQFDTSGLTSVQQTIYDSLFSFGLTPAQIVGILGNIGRESSFRTDAKGDKNSQGVYTSFGLCQWHNTRATSMKKRTPNWETNLSGQIDYLIYELNGDYRSVLTRFKTEVLGNTIEDAKVAAYIFMQDFEMPNKKDEAVNTARNNQYIEEIWSKLTVLSFNNTSDE